MKILKKKKKKKNFCFLRLGIFFSNWEKSHLNPIGKGAEFRPLRTPKKIPELSNKFNPKANIVTFHDHRKTSSCIGINWLLIIMFAVLETVVLCPCITVVSSVPIITKLFFF